jgi:4-hydroxy-tetrahydrodipicolinate synthase
MSDEAGTTREPSIGRVLTAMVTPFRDDRSLDLDAAQRMAAALVDGGNDGLVLSGTTGESATTTDAEKESLLRAVLDAVGDRAHVLTGVGTNDTVHSVDLARAAEKAGAHGVLVVTPYYNKPPQDGLLAHFTAVADATGLPVMLYDIPGRTGLAIATDTALRLAEHPRIVAVKDAKGDLFATQRVLAAGGLDVYSGDDMLNLPLLAVGAVGVVSVIGHVVPDRLAAMVAAVEQGRPGDARRHNAAMIPVTVEIMTRTQGAIMAKAALQLLGVLPSRATRLPLVDATPDQVEALRAGLQRAGVL